MAVRPCSTSSAGSEGCWRPLETDQKMDEMAGKKTQYRSAVTGEFVTKQFADRSKTTTVQERSKAPRRSPSTQRRK